MVHHLQKDEVLSKLLESAGDKLVVVDFSAHWCGPCKQIEPLFKELAGIHTDVVFIKVDVDECECAAGEYGITVLPTFVFFKNKQKVK